MSKSLRDAFLGEIADQVHYWEGAAANELAAGQSPQTVVVDSLRGLAHSLLVVIDGGTKLSDDGRVVWLTDADGRTIGEGLNETLPNLYDEGA
jgi:hypothetical protein